MIRNFTEEKSIGSNGGCHSRRSCLDIAFAGQGIRECTQSLPMDLYLGSKILTVRTCTLGTDLAKHTFHVKTPRRTV